MKQSYVYMMTNKPHGTLYVGVTSDLVKRVYEHRNDILEGFSRRYKLHALVYYEIHEDITEAIKREKKLKKMIRQWKVNLVSEFNPEWRDLYDGLF